MELSRSDAADAYVWKEETRVAGTQFKAGVKGVKRNAPDDWDVVKKAAKEGRLDDIPADIYVRSYNSFRRIQTDTYVRCYN